jgi:hypothetical protein
MYIDTRGAARAAPDDTRAPTARGPGRHKRLRPLHRTPSPTVRLQRALEALAKADVKARHFHATNHEPSLADGLYHVRCAAAGVALALAARA